MNSKIIKVEVEHGFWLFKLGKVLEDKQISKNKIMRDTNTKHDTLQGYVNGTLKRIDLDIVDRFCHYLKCNQIDIIEYIKK